MRKNLCLAVIARQLRSAEKDRRESRILYLQETHDPSTGPLVLDDHAVHIESVGRLEVALVALAEMLFPGGELRSKMLFKRQEIGMLEELAAFCAFNAVAIVYGSHSLEPSEQAELDQMQILTWYFRRVLDENMRSNSSAISGGGRITLASRRAYLRIDERSHQQLVDLFKLEPEQLQ